MIFRILDLFCGAGGFSDGLEQVRNFSTEVALDNDKNAVQTFKHNFPKAEVVLGDILNQKIQEKIVALCKERNVNMIIGGPPCQGFSLKGKNLGLNDSRNYLFKEYLNLVKIINPELFIIENVKNILNSGNHYFRDEILKEIKSLGYIINYGVLNAKNYGVPQNRERAFFIASKTKKINFPIPSRKIITVKDAISDLAYLESGEGEIETNYKNKPQSEYQKLLRGVFLQYHKASSHSQLAIEKLKMIPPEKGKEYLPITLHGKQKFSTTWSRLVWEEISPTIDTRFDTPSNGKNSHPILNRAITPREAARIQSFSDNFIFLGSKVAVCKQIGNAVPPLLAKAIGEKIIEELQSDVIKTENYSLYLGNAYTVIDEFLQQNVKVDHIITDPPYNISHESNFGTLKNPRTGTFFGEWDNNFDLLSWIPKYEKILKHDGSMIVFCSYRFISFIIETMEKSGLCVKDIIVWRKTNPMPRNINRRYVQDMEFAIWGVKKDAKWVFNKDKNRPYMRSLIETGTVSGAERTIHPTQKSLKLMKEILHTHTNENEIILDPFMGSGTTGVACIELKRKFIGIELDKKYFNITLERIKEQQTLFAYI
ncbi:MAG: DNA (cytosine-5-)-methyltransferase [Clostridia bacterium]|nr:DNA (cytosine-5-)-methyltransferase [Clostridia bacterium]